MEDQNVECILRVGGTDKKLFASASQLAVLSNSGTRVTLSGTTYKPKVTINLQPADPNMGQGPEVVYVDPVPVLELEAE